MTELRELFRSKGAELEELSLEVTSKCMCNCIHCSSGSSVAATVEMDVMDAIGWIDDAAQMGASVLSISGGDPLAYAHTESLILQADECMYRRVLVYTSGVAHIGIPEFMMNYGGAGNAFRAYDRRRLPVRVVNTSLPSYFFWNATGRLKNAVVVPIFSIHSSQPTIHDYILGVDGAWENAVKHIHHLTSNGIEVEVHVVPMAPAIKSTHDMDELRSLLKELGVKKMSILRFVPQTRGKMNRDILEMPKGLFVELQHWAHVTQFDEEMPEVRVGCPFDYRHALNLTHEKAKPCHAGHDLILIRPNGDVHPCAAWKTLTNSNAHLQSLRDILEKSETFVKLRHHHSHAAHGYSHTGTGFDEDEGVQIASETCLRCIHFSTCAGGCPAQRLHHANAKSVQAIFSELTDPMCPKIGIGGQVESSSAKG